MAIFLLFFLKKGMPCAAFYKDNSKLNCGKWERAEILNKIDKSLSVEILYVDYGHVEVTHLFSLRNLKPEFTKFSVDVNFFKN